MISILCEFPQCLEDDWMYAERWCFVQPSPLRDVSVAFACYGSSLTTTFIAIQGLRFLLDNARIVVANILIHLKGLTDEEKGFSCSHNLIVLFSMVSQVSSCAPATRCVHLCFLQTCGSEQTKTDRVSGVLAQFCLSELARRIMNPHLSTGHVSGH